MLRGVLLDVDSVRALSWEIFGDEDLIFFVVFLGMPSIAVVIYLCYRVFKINERLQYATKYRQTQAEMEIAAEVSSSGEDDNVMGLDEMLAMSAELNAQQPVDLTTLRRRKPACKKHG